MRYNLKSTLLTAAFSTLLLVGGCATPPPTTVTSQDLSSTQQKVSQLLAQAQSSPPGVAENHFLNAADLLLSNRQADESLTILQHLDYQALSSNQKYRYILIFSAANISLGKPDIALNLLSGSRLNISALTPFLSIDEQISLDQLRAQAYEEVGKHYEAVRERVFFNALLSSEARQLNQEKIWKSLQNIPLTELQSFPDQQASRELSGWIQLATLAKSNTYDIDAQQRSLTKWLALWPAHPAAQNLPPRLAILSQIDEFRPKRIALLLPLSGQLSRPAMAIRNGFLSNYYLTRSRKNPTAALSIYNTDNNEKSFTEIYHEAILSGAELVIGPLKKQNVRQLEAMGELPVRTLTLNYGEGTQETISTNLVEFGLSPEDETRQVALKAFSDGHDKAAILYPDNTWGYRLAQSFSEHWQKIGGEVLTQEGFPVKNNYGPSLKSLLNIPQSEARATRIKRILGSPLEFTARRRKDIDFIATFALPSQAKQLKPGLDFYFAGDIPLYSTSHIYSTAPTQYKNNKDLDGIQFCDAPWVLEKHSDLLYTLDAAWPKRNKHLERLYALGADAYHLSAWLPILKNVPDIWIAGQTGKLQLLSNQRIQRALPWATLESGVPGGTSPAILETL